MSNGERPLRHECRAEWRDLHRFSTRQPVAATTYVKVGWPVFAWRSVVPRLPDRKTDPLQRAILRFASANVANNSEIGRLLGLHPLLVRQAQQACLVSNLLDRNMQLTPMGKSLLLDNEDDEICGTIVELGWIFRDALTGDVWPMFYRGSLPAAPRPAVREAVFLPADDEFSEKPSSASISSALQAFQRIIRYEPDADDTTGLLADLYDPGDFMPNQWDAADGDTDGMQQSALAPKSIRLPTLQPERISIEARLYRTSDDPLGWAVASPFGLAGGWWFKRKLDWAINHQADISSTLAPFTHSVVPSPTELVTLVDEPRQRVRLEYSILERVQQLNPVVEMMRLSLAAEEQYHTNPENLDLVLTRYHKCLEALLNACLETIPDTDRWRVVKMVDERGCYTLFRGISKELNLDLPQPFLNPDQRWNLRNVAKRRGKAVRDRVAFLIADAAVNQTSQCRPLFMAQPGLLFDLDLVADRRNSHGAHFNGAMEVPSDGVFLDVQQAFSRSVQTLTSYFFEEEANG